MSKSVFEQFLERASLNLLLRPEELKTRHGQTATWFIKQHQCQHDLWSINQKLIAYGEELADIVQALRPAITRAKALMVAQHSRREVEGLGQTGLDLSSKTAVHLLRELGQADLVQTLQHFQAQRLQTLITAMAADPSGAAQHAASSIGQESVDSARKSAESVEDGDL